MPNDTKEPQSYGSQGDWTSGETGEEVNRLKGHPNSQHADFYESRHDYDPARPPETGGLVSTAGNGESVAHPAETSTDADPAQNVTTTEGGAHRSAFFRKRDYEGR